MLIVYFMVKNVAIFQIIMAALCFVDLMMQPTFLSIFAEGYCLAWAYVLQTKSQGD